MAIGIQRNSNTITVATFYENHLLGKYDYEPPYQRKSVWHPEKKRFLIDSVLKNFPIPPIFLHQEIDVKSGKTMYRVIDGKQRLSAILDFIEKRITLPDDYGGDEFGDERLNGADFAQLDGKEFTDLKQQFWRYVIPIEYIDNVTEPIVQNIFDRLNRNGDPLTPQELRHAQFHASKLIQLATKLAKERPWDELLKRLEIIRMEDVEFISDLLFIVLTDEVQDGNKGALDDLYQRFSADNAADWEVAERRFKEVTAFFTSLEIPLERYRLSGVTHVYVIWAFSHYCVTHEVKAGQVRDAVNAMFRELRESNERTVNVEDYRRSTMARTKDQGTRKRRVNSMLRYCGLIAQTEQV
jgi:hypothetical protein